MNVLFLSTWSPYPPDNGSKIRAFHLLNALVKSHQVTVVAFAPEASDISRLLETDNVASTFLVAANPFAYVKLPQLVKYISPQPLAFWRNRVMSETVARLARERSWDVVVAIQMHVSRYGLLLPDIPRILDVDTALSYQLDERYRRATGLIDRLRARVSCQKARRYESRILRQYQLGTVVSSLEKCYVSGLAGNCGPQIELIPNGVDCKHYQVYHGERERRHMVYSGALSYSANYDAMSFFLSAIFPLIKRELADTRLTISGSTNGVDLSALRLCDGVRLSGYVTDIRPLVARAGVSVVPLREGGGTRLKILEAMALGTPVVSTTKGAEGLDVIDGEHLLIADEPERFAAHTIELMCRPELRQRLTENARRLVEEKYDWEVIGRRFVFLIENVVAERKQAT